MSTAENPMCSQESPLAADISAIALLAYNTFSGNDNIGTMADLGPLSRQEPPA